MKQTDTLNATKPTSTDNIEQLQPRFVYTVRHVLPNRGNSQAPTHISIVVKVFWFSRGLVTSQVVNVSIKRWGLVGRMTKLYTTKEGDLPVSAFPNDFLFLFLSRSLTRKKIHLHRISLIQDIEKTTWSDCFFAIRILSRQCQRHGWTFHGGILSMSSFPLPSCLWAYASANP